MLLLIERIIISLLALQLFELSALSLNLELLTILLFLNSRTFLILVVHRVSKKCSTKCACGSTNRNTWTRMTRCASDECAKPGTESGTGKCSRRRFVHWLRTCRSEAHY